MKYTALINDKTYEIEIGANNTVMVDGEPHNVDFRTIDGARCTHYCSTTRPGKRSWIVTATSIAC